MSISYKSRFDTTIANRGFTAATMIRETILIDTITIDSWITRFEATQINNYSIFIFLDKLVYPKSFNFQSVAEYMEKIQYVVMPDVIRAVSYTSDLTKMIPKENVEMGELNINFLEYQMLIGSRVEIKTKTIHCRFLPTKKETAMMNKMLTEGWVFKFPLDNLGKVEEVIKRSDLIRLSIQRAVVTAKKIKKEEKEPSITTMQELSDMVNVMNEEMTLKRVKIYLKARHNIFAYKCSAISDTFVFDQLDVDLVRKFGYTGIYSTKTPDWAFEAEDGLIYIVDFAVTEGRSDLIFQKKMDKYTPLAENMSAELKKKVVIIPMVYNIRNPSESMFSNLGIEERQQLLEMCDELKFVNDRVKMIDRYEEFRALFEISDEEDEAMVKMDSLLSAMATMAESFPKVSSNILDSSYNLEIPKEMKIPEMDSKMMHLLSKAKRVSPESYMNITCEEMRAMMKENKFSKEMELILKTGDKEILAEISLQRKESLAKGKLVEKKLLGRFPKLFKIPIILSNIRTHMTSVLSDRHIYWTLNDGTMLLRENMSKSLFSNPKTQDRNKREIFIENREGIHIQEKAEDYVEDFYEMFMEKSSDKFQEKMLNDMESAFINPGEEITGIMREERFSWFKEVIKLKGMEILFLIGEMFHDLCYLEGRRHLGKNEEEAKKCHTVMKEFDNYTLVIHKGSRATIGKSIRYKVLISKNSVLQRDYLHTWNMKGDYLESTWFSATLTDLAHYSMVFQKAMALMSHLYDSRVQYDSTPLRFIDREFVFPMFILLDHKRGTSTSLQLNRYIVHSSTSLVSDSVGLVRSIMKDPVRGLFESYIRKKQLDWYEALLTTSRKRVMESLLLVSVNEPGFDTLYLSSFFNVNKMVEFGWTMSEMYYANMFNKDHGFNSHRVKAICEKMVTEEIHYLKVKDSPESFGDVADQKAFMQAEDSHHKFSYKFVAAAAKKLSDKLKRHPSYATKMFDFMTQVVDNSMMLTSSVSKVTIPSVTMPVSEKLEKKFSFETIREKVAELGTHTLKGMVSQMDVCEAFFDLFPKAQIGGPREILIMAVSLRLMVKVVESLSANLCDLHEKEMLTKDQLKASRQSDVMEEHRREAMLFNGNNKTKWKFNFQINTDASKWAPSMVMAQLLVFMDNLDIPMELKNFCLSVIRAFATKRIYLPKDLIEKWKKKPDDEKEASMIMEWYRNSAKDQDWAPFIYSGMGQGMLHFLSSLYHCAMDDMMDDLMSRVLTVEMRSVTLISSDDKTKMVSVTLQRGKPEMFKAFIKWYVIYFDALQRLANMHVNWKKTAFQTLICEFNSMFSRQKRVVLASVKDIYTSMEIVDLTSPEMAVQMVFSSLRRCMDHGVYLSTLKIMAVMMRNWLKKVYRLDGVVERQLVDLLGVRPDHLPHHLGFMSTDMLVEQCLFGPDVTMHRLTNSPSLMKFYRNVYTNQSWEIEENVTEDVADKQISGKHKLSLGIRLDKRLKTIRERVIGDKHAVDAIEKELEKYALYLGAQTDLRMHWIFSDSYLLTSGRKYDIQDSMKIHSLVRALSLSTKKAKCQSLNLENVGVLEYVIAILKIPENTRSCFGLTNSLFEVAKEADKIQKTLGTLTRDSEKRDTRHPKMRNLRFYLTKVWSDYTTSEILDVLTMKKADHTTRAMNCTEEIVKFFGKSIQDFEDSPLNTIKSLFPKSEKPFSNFLEFMEYHKKTLRMTSVNMLADFPDTGNAFGNLLNLYRYRSFPEFVFDSNEITAKSKQTDTVMTWMALKGDVSECFAANPDMDFGDFQENDTTFNFYLKMMKRVDENLIFETKQDTVPSKTLFREENYRISGMARRIFHYYNICSYGMISLNEKKKEAVISLYHSNEDPLVNKTLHNLMYSDLLKLQRENYVFLNRFTREEADYDQKIGSFSINVKMISLRVKVTTSFRASEWQAYIHFLDIEETPRLLLMTDRYHISHYVLEDEVFSDFGASLMSMLRDDITLHEVYTFFQNNNWIKGQRAPRFNEEVKGEDERLTSRDYNEYISTNNYFDMSTSLAHLMSSLTALTSTIPEEEFKTEQDVVPFETAMLDVSAVSDSNINLLLEAISEQNKDFERYKLIPSDISLTERFSATSVINTLLSKSVWGFFTINIFQFRDYVKKYGKMAYSILFVHLKEILKEYLKQSDVEEDFVMMVYCRLCSQLAGRVDNTNFFDVKIPEGELLDLFKSLPSVMVMMRYADTKTDEALKAAMKRLGW